MRTREDIIILIYKIFILFLISIQVYNFIFEEINGLTLTTNIILIIYFTFRFYLLVKLSKNIKNLKLPIKDFLNMKYFAYSGFTNKESKSNDSEIEKE